MTFNLTGWYRKKSVVVSAEQWLRDGDCKPFVGPYRRPNDDPARPCPTCKNAMREHGSMVLDDDAVCPGDWVVTESGRRRIVDSTAFGREYEGVEAEARRHGEYLSILRRLEWVPSLLPLPNPESRQWRCPYCAACVVVDVRVSRPTRVFHNDGCRLAEALSAADAPDASSDAPQTGAASTPDGAAQSTMPLVCDRCGAAPLGPDHHLFSFDLWPGDDYKRRAPAGRVCLDCARAVQAALVDLARRMNLTCRSNDAYTSIGHGGRTRVEADARPRAEHPSASDDYGYAEIAVFRRREPWGNRWDLVRAVSFDPNQNLPPWAEKTRRSAAVIRPGDWILSPFDDGNDDDEATTAQTSPAAFMREYEPYHGLSLKREDVATLQKRILANRRRRGWPSAHDLSKTIAGLAEEVGEFARSQKKKDRAAAIDALADVVVWCLGGFEILGVDGLEEIAKVVASNETREHEGHH